MKGLAKSLNPRADKEKSRDMIESGGVETLSWLSPFNSCWKNTFRSSGLKRSTCGLPIGVSSHKRDHSSHVPGEQGCKGGSAFDLDGEDL